MSRHCGSCHHSCDCREHRVAVLVKVALDLACEVDSLKAISRIAPEEKDRIQGIVERTYTACEDLGAEIGASEVPA